MSLRRLAPLVALLVVTLAFWLLLTPGSPTVAQLAARLPHRTAETTPSSAGPTNQKASVSVIAAARSRQDRLRRLMASDPARALAESISFAQYAALPEALREYYEQPFAAIAALDVIPVCGATEARTLVVLRHGERTYSAFAAGPHVSASSRASRPVHGILLGDQAVVADTPLALLSPEDAALFAHLSLGQPDPARDFSTGAPLGTSPVVALAGNRRLLFADHASAEAFNQRLATLDLRPGPQGGSALALALPYPSDPSAGFDWTAAAAAVDTAASAWTETPKNVFFIRADFSDAPGSLSQASLSEQINTRVASSLREMSYGKTTVTTGVSSMIVRLPQASTAYKTNSFLLYDDALAAYRALAGAQSLNGYDIIGVQFPSIGASSGIVYAGLATMGGSRHWLQGNPSDKTIVHEFGHNYGIGHAHAWKTSDGSVMGTGELVEYGDPFDVMGSGSPPEGHFHSQAKVALNWITSSGWVDANVRGSGTYRLHRFDHADTTGTLRGLRVIKDPSATAYQVGYYWVGYRPGIPGNTFLSQGAYLTWERPGIDNAALLDPTPNSSAGLTDAALRVGVTYSDTTAGVHLTPLATGGSGADAWMDLHVELGTFPANQPPSATFSPPASTAARTPTTLTVVATDPNGDPLAYDWELGDGSAPLSAATRTHSWNTGGTYDISVRISDRKGGVTTRTATVTVTDPLLTWNSSTVAASGNLSAVTYLRGRHFAFQSSSIYSSLDRVNWTVSNLGNNNRMNACAANTTAFIAVGADYDYSTSRWIGAINRSLDGRIWQQITLPAQVAELTSVAASDTGVCVAVGYSGALLRSTDSGATWTILPAPAGSPGLRSAAYSNGLFMIAGDNNTLLSSTDGLTWTDRSSSITQGTIIQVLHADGVWYAATLTTINRSVDGGQTWTRVALALSGNYVIIQRLAAGPGILIAYAHQGSTNSPPSLLVSTDGLFWGATPPGTTIPATSSLIYADGAFQFVTGTDGSLRRSEPFVTGNRPPAAITLQSVTTAAARQPVAFTSSATDPDGDSLRHLWDFGDGSAYQEGNTASHTFAVGGTYTVKLHVTDSRGGLVTTEKTITVTDPLLTWDTSTVAPSQAFNAVAFLRGRHFLGGSQSIYASLDRTNWSVVALGNSNRVHAFAADATAFIAVGIDYDFSTSRWLGVVHRSLDGRSWQKVALPAPVAELAAVAADGNGTFVAVGASGTLLRSSDSGATWTILPAPAGAPALRAIAYGSGLFMVAGERCLITSADGLTWSENSPAAAQNYFNHVLHVGGIWYAATSGTIDRSTDGGLTWTRAKFAPYSTGFSIQRLAAGPGILVATATRYEGAVTTPAFLVSMDGLTWTSTLAAAPFPATSAFVYADGAFHSGSSSGGEFRRSGPFVTGNRPPTTITLQSVATAAARQPVAFTSSATDPDGDPLRHLWDFGDGSAYHEGNSASHTFAVGGTYTVKLHITDSRGGLATTEKIITVTEPLSVWTQRSSGTNTTLRDVVLAPSGRLVAVGGNSGTYRVSTDGGATWPSGGTLATNTYLFGVHYAAGLFVTVGETYDFSVSAWRGVIYTSTDGLAWTRRLFAGPGLRAVTHGAGAFIAVGLDGTIHRSVDGVTWTPISSGTTNHLYAVTLGAGLFLAAGANSSSIDGTVLTSTNGETWTNRSAGLGTTQGLFTADYVGDRFLVSGFYSGIRHSTDGGGRFTVASAFEIHAAGFATINGLYFAAAINRNQSSAPLSLVSQDGVNWNAISAPAFGERYAVIAVGTTFLSVGANGEIWQSAPAPAEAGGYDNWRAARFSARPADGEATADADHDGASNLAEYLAGTDPLSASASPVFAPSLLAGEITLAVPRAAHVGDVLVRFETSTDLITWTDAGIVVIETPEEIIGTIDFDTARRFLRARLELIR